MENLKDYSIPFIMGQLSGAIINITKEQDNIKKFNVKNHHNFELVEKELLLDFSIEVDKKQKDLRLIISEDNMHNKTSYKISLNGFTNNNTFIYVDDLNNIHSSDIFELFKNYSGEDL